MSGGTVAQIVLIALVVGVGVYVFTLRTMFTDRLAMLFIAAIGAVLIAWPGLSTDAAKLVGIGRGTDLVFYLFIIFCLFRFVSTAAGMRKLEARLTRVVREAALRNARPAPDTNGPATGLLERGGYRSGSHDQGSTAE